MLISKALKGCSMLQGVPDRDYSGWTGVICCLGVQL
jgi:hypothetical protein